MQQQGGERGRPGRRGCCRGYGFAQLTLDARGEAEMMEKDLILSGKCKHCGKEVRRVVEPQD